MPRKECKQAAGDAAQGVQNKQCIVAVAEQRGVFSGKSGEGAEGAAKTADEEKVDTVVAGKALVGGKGHAEDQAGDEVDGQSGQGEAVV